MRPTLLLGVALWLLLWTVGVGSASAHANLERSSPSSNAVLPQAPRQILIVFSEEPEPRFSEIAVYQASGAPVEAGPLHPLPGQPRTYAVDLPALPDGPYTVAWKTLSAVDGHTAAGAYTFAVGVGQTPGAPSLPVAATAETSLDWPEAAIRWLTYLGTAVLVGAVPFSAFVAGPSFRSRPGLGRASRRVALAAAGLVLVVGPLGLVVQAAGASGVSPLAAIGGPTAALLGTRYGLLWLARMGLVVGLALLIGRGTLETSRARPRVLLALLVAGAILATLSLNSHAAAMQVDTTLALGLDWVHLAGMATWLGGLVQLLTVALVLARQGGAGRRQLLGRLVGDFSPFATWSVVALLGSGLYQAVVQVSSLAALTETPYGQSLLWKLGLVVPMLALGLVNTAIIRPRLAAGRRAAGVQTTVGTQGDPAEARAVRAARLFSWTVGAEVLAGVLVLAATGLLTTQEPAREALARMPQLFDASQRADDLRVRLRIAPPAAGLATFTVALQEPGGAVAPAERVTLRFQHLEHGMGENEVTLARQADGRWSTQGSYLSMVGSWRVSVLVRREGRDDARADFQVAAADPTLPATRPSGPVSVGSALVGGVVLILVAVGLLGRTRQAARPALARAGAVAIMAAGGYLFWTGLTRDVTPTFALANPIPPSRESIERGQQVYAQNCFACHGATGRGDGPAGRLLQPRPADLRLHVTAHTEGQLYWWISNGFPGSAMPAFEDQLSEEDRWNVLNYIVQSFASGGTAP
jgi:copper transport protein